MTLKTKKNWRQEERCIQVERYSRDELMTSREEENGPSCVKNKRVLVRRKAEDEGYFRRFTRKDFFKFESRQSLDFGCI